MTPPPLMWVLDVVDSMSRALGCAASVLIKGTTNPLMYTIDFAFGERQTPRVLGQLWNLVQMYAARNDAVADAVNVDDPNHLKVRVIIKRRLGPPRRDSP